MKSLSTIEHYIKDCVEEHCTKKHCVLIHDYAKDGGEELFTRCIAFSMRIFDDSIGIQLQNAMHLGKKYLGAIFSVIICFGVFLSSDTIDKHSMATKLQYNMT